MAFFIYSFLSDRWDGMSGSYLGKDWSIIDYLFDLHEVENKKEILYFMKIYEGLVVNQRAEEAEKRRKAEQRKSKAAGGGKNYTHNVRG